MHGYCIGYESVIAAHGCALQLPGVVAELNWCYQVYFFRVAGHG
jgi:hypothetical protein